MYFTHSIQFPFTKTTINFKELTCYQCFNLIKINNNFPPEADYRLDYHRLLIEIIQDSIKEKENLYKLNIIEFLMLCIRLRTVSISSTIELSLESEKNTNVVINFYDVLFNILSISNNIKKFEIIKHEDTEIYLNWPLLQNEEYFLSTINDEYINRFLNSIPIFIDKIKIKDNLFDFNLFDPEQKKELMNSLPASIKNIIQTNIITLLKEISEFYIFGIKQFEQYKLEFFNATIQDLIRFLFAGSEDSKILEIVFLKKHGFSIQEINEMCPLEKNNLLNYLTQELKNENK
jgi:hypothetical protein